STASMCLRKDSDCVYSQTRLQASSRNGKASPSKWDSIAYWSIGDGLNTNPLRKVYEKRIRGMWRWPWRHTSGCGSAEREAKTGSDQAKVRRKASPSPA